MFVDSASGFQHIYGTRVKSVAAIIAVEKRIIAHRGVPRAFQSDNGQEYPNQSFVECCNNLGIRRFDGAVYTSTKWSRGERTIESV